MKTLAEDMMLTTYRSIDNGAMRLAIAYHERLSIGRMEKSDGDGTMRPIFRTTPEWDDWVSSFMGMPGLTPRRWHNDPHWAEHDETRRIAGHPYDYRSVIDFRNKNGAKRMLLILDTEEQAMLFKMRWQDEPISR